MGAIKLRYQHNFDNFRKNLQIGFKIRSLCRHSYNTWPTMLTWAMIVVIINKSIFADAWKFKRNRGLLL